MSATKTKPIREELYNLIRAKYPIIYLETHEEKRAVNILARIAEKLQEEYKDKKLVLVWAATTGLTQLIPTKTRDGEPTFKPIPDTEDPVAALQYVATSTDQLIVIMKDLHRFMDNPIVYRKLRDLYEQLKIASKTIIMLSPVFKIPEELKKCVTLKTLPLPEKEELMTMLDTTVKMIGQLAGTGDPKAESTLKAERTLKSVKDTLENNGNREAILRAGLGLTLNEYEDVLMKSIVETHSLDIQVIISEKEQIIKKSGVLEFFTSLADLKDVGGLGNLKQYVARRKNAFSDKAKKFGLKNPKGVLLIGSPGTGKTLVAKAIASYMQVPLLKVDISKIYGGIVGATEQNISNALKMAEVVAPCVLLFDEMEKALAGSSSGETDSGVSSHLRSILLSWMNDHESPVYVVGTVNEPQNLNPAIMRAGRFDEIFFVDIPTELERIEIFSIHLRKVGRDPKNYDINALARSSDGFSGAEIESVIQDALATAYDGEIELTDDHILTAINTTLPISKRRKEELDALRVWCAANAVPASLPSEAAVTDQTRKKRKVNL